METIDSSLHSKVRQTSDAKLIKIMDMMKPRIHYFKDLKNHTYFFEQPSYTDARSIKFFKKLSQPNEVKIEILEDLHTLLS